MPFVRLAGLMGHIDQDKCPVIQKSQIHEQRAKKVDFINQLGIGLKRGSGIQLGPGKADPDFSRFMIDGFDTASVATGPSVDAEVPANDEQNFPSMPVQDKRKGRAGAEQLGAFINESKADSHAGQPVISWAQEMDLFPHTAPAARPSPELLAALTEPPKSVENAWGPHDPANPQFRVSDYWNDFLQKYQCPYACG